MRDKGIEADEVNYAKTGLDEATVKRIVASAGGVAAVLNPRHELAKARGWGEHPPSAATFAAAVVDEPNLMRRPIYIDGKQVIVGYDKATKETWARL